MAINLFDLTGKTSSSAVTFGLCDDPSPATNPAYIDEADATKWIGEVTNPLAKNIDFYAIDHCVEIRRPNGEMESRCDGLLHHENKLTFVELKDRSFRGWLGKACEQLTITVGIFKANHDVTVYDDINAHVCNKQRPFFKSGFNTVIQKFNDDTGYILNVQKEITV